MPKLEKEKIIADAVSTISNPIQSKKENQNVKIISLIKILVSSFSTFCTTTKCKVEIAWNTRKNLGSKVQHQFFLCVYLCLNNICIY